MQVQIEQQKLFVLARDGSRIVTNPETGQAWQDKQMANAWIQRELLRLKPDLHNETDSYLGIIQIDSVAVKEQTGNLITTTELEGQPSEVTVSVGTVLTIKASLLATGAGDDKLQQLENQLFRIPLKNQKTGEVLLFAGLVEQGLIELEVPLQQVGFWQVDQQLINEKLPAEHRLAMTALTISVVNSHPGLLAKLAALVAKK